MMKDTTYPNNHQSFQNAREPGSHNLARAACESSNPTYLYYVRTVRSVASSTKINK